MLRNNEVFNNTNPPLCRRSSIGTFIRPHSTDANSSGSASSSIAAGGKLAKAPAPRLDYRSMVSIDDMPELFQSFDSKFHFKKILTNIWVGVL